MRNAYIILVRKPKGQSIWKIKHEWEDNVKMDIKET
jgi:hypothetical protein